MFSSVLHHDAFLAEKGEPFLCHIRCQAEEDAHDTRGDVAVRLEIILDFRQHLFLRVFSGLIGIARAFEVYITMYLLHQLHFWAEVDACDANFLTRYRLLLNLFWHLKTCRHGEITYPRNVETMSHGELFHKNVVKFSQHRSHITFGERASILNFLLQLLFGHRLMLNDANELTLLATALNIVQGVNVVFQFHSIKCIKLGIKKFICKYE